MIPKLAVHQNDDGGAQEKGGDHPGEVIQPAEFAHDGG